MTSERRGSTTIGSRMSNCSNCWIQASPMTGSKAHCSARGKGFDRNRIWPATVAVLSLGFFLMVAGSNVLGQNGQGQGQIGYQSAPGADQRKTLLLKDFDPKSMLHVPEHFPQRAKYYVLDVHNHTNDPAGIGDQMPPQDVVKVMDQSNVKLIVILTGMWGEKLQHVIDTMVKPYPGRFMVFTQIDWSKIDDQNFSQEMVRQLDDGVSRGARGLKILKDLGLGVRDKSGKLITVDDPRLDPIFDECGRLGIPVFIHTGDPEAFFHPIDAVNERYEELNEHPDWSFFGSGFPGL